MIDSTLEAYILEEHTDQIKTLRDRVHSISNLLVKDKQLLESLEKNISEVRQQIERITVQLEKNSDRLYKLEEKEVVRESKRSLFKQGIRYWPFLVFMVAVIDYNKILLSIKNFAHLN